MPSPTNAVVADCWQDQILKALKERNALSRGYGPLIEAQKSLLHQTKTYKSQVATLNTQLAQATTMSSEIESVADTSSSERKLRRQLSDLQVKLTEKYKIRAESTANVLDLTTTNSKLETECKSLESQIQKLQAQEASYKSQIERLNIAVEAETHDKNVIEQELLRVRSLLEATEASVTQLTIENAKLKTEQTTLVAQYLAEKTKWMEQLNDKNEASAVTSTTPAKEPTTDSSERTSSNDNSIIETASLFYIPTNKKHSFKAHATEINRVVFNSAGSWVLTASSDSSIRVWDTTSGRVRTDFKTSNSHTFLSVDITDDGESVVGGCSDRTVRVWNVATGRARHTLTGHGGKVHAASFAGAAAAAVTGASDRCIKVWDLSRGYCTKTLNCRSACHDLGINTSASVDVVVSGHQDGAIRLWDIRQSVLSSTIIPSDLHSSVITSVMFSSSGRYVLSSGRDNTIKLVDTRTWKVASTFSDSEKFRLGSNWAQVGMHPKESFVVGGSTTGELCVWNAVTGKLEEESSGCRHQSPVICVAVNSSGSTMASADKNGYLLLWE